MYIAIVDFDVAPEHRAQALDALLKEVASVRATDGCVNFRPFTDPQSETHVGVLHEWSTAEGFGTYLSSPGFARSGEILRPLMTGPPGSRRYKAELLEEVN